MSLDDIKSELGDILPRQISKSGLNEEGFYKDADIGIEGIKLQSERCGIISVNDRLKENNKQLILEAQRIARTNEEQFEKYKDIALKKIEEAKRMRDALIAAPDEIISYNNETRRPFIDDFVNYLEPHLSFFGIDRKKIIEEGTLKYFKKLKQKGADYFGPGGNLETHYIGEYTLRENKSFLIRVYDKIADIKKKGKQKLYSEYLTYNDVTRIEIEFRIEVTKGMKYELLLDKNYLFNLFILYIEKHSNIFENLKNQDVKKLKRVNKKIELESLKYNDVIRKKYLSAFKGYAKKILEIGICPIDILFKNNLISESTSTKIPKAMHNNKFDLKMYSEEKSLNLDPNSGKLWKEWN